MANSSTVTISIPCRGNRRAKRLANRLRVNGISALEHDWETDVSQRKGHMISVGVRDTTVELEVWIGEPSPPPPKPPVPMGPTYEQRGI